MAESDPPHPIAHVDPDKRYEWMLAQCAALEASRQAREDGLVSTITQISSAALLAIPGLFFSTDARMPPLQQAPLIYVGIMLFLIALIFAMLEQHFSGRAFRRQVEVTQAYYAQQSTETHDPASIKLTQRLRMSSYL